MFCVNCGHEKKESHIFCTKCGNKHDQRNAHIPHVESKVSNTKKRFDFFEFMFKNLFVILIILFIVPIAVSFGVKAIKDKNAATQALITNQQQLIDNAQKAINDEQARSEQDKLDLQSKIDNLNQQVSGAGLSTSDAVKEWQNRIARVQCFWINDDIEGDGSGMLAYFSNYGLVAISNKHVITDSSGNPPDSCIVGIYGIGGRVISNHNPFSNGLDEDWGIIQIDPIYQSYDSTATDNGVFDSVAKDPINVCATEPNIGDKILVLGYPAIGTEGGITATEGIISGVEQNYYVTSAKIDHGNSGGAAILLKDDCYLGIPTYVVNLGGFESLGRILKASLIFNKPFWNNDSNNN